MRDIVEIEIKADSLDDALATAKGLKAEDFTSIEGEHIDGSFRVLGVSAEWPDLYD